MYHYAFTLRNLTNSKAEDYPPAILSFKQKYPHVHVEYHYEVKFKKNGHHNIHIHGCMKSPKKISWRMLASCCTFPNRHVYMDFIKTQGWVSYITKQKLITIEDVNTLLMAYTNGEVPLEPRSDDGYESDGFRDPLERTITGNLFRNI